MDRQSLASGGSGRPAIPSLTGLRYIAAASVVVYHIVPRGPARLPAIVMNAIDMSGDAAVCFFFCLSGFILVYSDLNPAGEMRWKPADFWRARFARIYPMYLFAFLVAALPTFWGLQSGHGTKGALERMALYGPVSALLLQSWTPFTAASWNAPGWSLSDESFFYGMFPFLRSMNKLAQPTWLAILASCCLVTSVPNLLLHHAYPAGTVPALLAYTVTYQPLLRIPEFIAGMVVGMMRLRLQASGSLARIASSLPSIGLLMVILLFAFFAHGWWLRSALVPFYLLLIFALSLDDSPFANRVLGQPWMVRLGEASYSVYILHLPVWVYVSKAFHQEHQPNLTLVFGYVAFITGLSLLTYQYIERPWARRSRPERSKSAVRSPVGHSLEVNGGGTSTSF